MADEAYRKVVSIVDNTVSNAGELLQRLPALKPKQSEIENNANCTNNNLQSKEIDDTDCTTAPDQSDKPSPVAHTPPCSWSRSLSSKSEKRQQRLCAGGSRRRTCLSCSGPRRRITRPCSQSRPRLSCQRRSPSQVKIMHAENVYISCDSDGLSIAMPKASKHSKKCQKQKQVTNLDSPSRGVRQKEKSGSEIEQGSFASEFESSSTRYPKKVAKGSSRRTKNDEKSEGSEVVAQAVDLDSTPLPPPKRVAKKLARSSTPRKDKSEKDSEIQDLGSRSARSPRKSGKKLAKKADSRSNLGTGDDYQISELGFSTRSPKRIAKKLSRKHEPLFALDGSQTEKFSATSTRSSKRRAKKSSRRTSLKKEVPEQVEYRSNIAQFPKKAIKKLAKTKMAITGSRSGTGCSQMAEFGFSTRSPKRTAKKCTSKASSQREALDDIETAKLDSSTTRLPRKATKKLVKKATTRSESGTRDSQIAEFGSSAQSPETAKKFLRRASTRKKEAPSNSKIPDFDSSTAKSPRKAAKKLAKKATTGRESGIRDSQMGEFSSSAQSPKRIAKKLSGTSSRKEVSGGLELAQDRSSTAQSPRKIAKKLAKKATTERESGIRDSQMGEFSSSAQSPKRIAKKLSGTSPRKEVSGGLELAQDRSSIAQSQRKAAKKLAKKAIIRSGSGTREGFQMTEFGSSTQSLKKRAKKSLRRLRPTKEEDLESLRVSEIGSSSARPLRKVAKKKLKTVASGGSESEEVSKSSRKRTPKVVSPKRKSLNQTSRTSTTTKKKAKSYLKETVTRTVITTTKEVPEGREAAIKDPSKGVVKKREVKTTTTTKLYSDKSPGTPLPKPVTKHTFTRVLLSGRKPAVTPTGGNDVLLALKAALESKLAAFQPSLKPKDPYRPPKALPTVAKGMKAPTLVPTAIKAGYGMTRKSTIPTYVGKTPKEVTARTSKKKTATLSGRSDGSSVSESIETAKTYSSKWAPARTGKVKKCQKPTNTWSQREEQPASAPFYIKPQKSGNTPQVKPKSPKRKAASPKRRYENNSFLDPVETAKTYSSRKSTPARKRSASKKSLSLSLSEKKQPPFNPSVKVLKLNLSSLDSSISSKRAKKKNSTRKPNGSDLSESITTARASTPMKRSFPSKKKSQPSKKLLPWGLSSAENPIEKPEREEKAQSPQATLSFSSSQSSLLGRPVQRRSPPSARWRKKKEKESLKPAVVSESYLERQLKFAIAGRKITANQKGQKIRSARDKIKKSRKSMKEQDAEQRASGTFQNPVKPRYLKPKYEVPNEVKIKSEGSDESSWRSSSRRKSKTPRKKNKRLSSNTDDESISTARALTPIRWRSTTSKRTKPESSPKRLLPWGLSSAENPIEPRKREKKESPEIVLQYNSSHSCLLGHPVHRCSPPSSRHRHHHHKKKHTHSFKEAGVSESYLDHQIQLSIGGPKSTTLKVQKARDSIRESRKAMKEQDKERRSTQKFTNPVTPKYLKPKYAIPPELQVRREPDDEVEKSSKSVQTEPPSALSEMSSISGSTKSDGIVYASEKAKKQKKKKRSSKMSKRKKKAGHRKERPPVDSEISDSYRSPHMNHFAIAGRKVRKRTSPEKLEKIRKSREQIRESRKVMKKFDTGSRLSKEFTHNPGKAPNLHSIKKKQAELASRLSGNPSPSAVNLESSTSVVMDHSMPPSPPPPKIGKRFQRKDKEELRKKSRSRTRKAHERKKYDELRPAAPSKSWLEHSLKFAEDGRKAWSRAQHEARTPQSFKKRSKTNLYLSKPGSERSKGSDSADEDVSTAKGSVSMDEQDSAKEERRECRPKARGKSPRRASSRRLGTRSRPSGRDLSDKELITARSGTPPNAKKRAKDLPCWRCSNRSPIVAQRCIMERCETLPSRPVRFDVSPWDVLGSSKHAAGHSEKTSTSSNPSWCNEKRIPSAKRLNEEQLPDVSTAKDPGSDRAPYSLLPNRTLNDLKFDAKFHLRDIDSNMEHTLVINGYFLDKNLKRLTLNGRFCRI